MENEALPFYKVPGTEGAPDKFYLRGITGNDTEISAAQYNALTTTTGKPVNGDQLPEATIARLHAEQDPASPLFKGSEPVGNKVSGTAANHGEAPGSYYELTGDKVEAAEAESPATPGDSVHTTSEVTKAEAQRYEPATEPDPELIDPNASTAKS